MEAEKLEVCGLVNFELERPGSGILGQDTIVSHSCFFFTLNTH